MSTITLQQINFQNVNAAMVIKTITLLAAYIIPFLIIILVQPSFLVMNLLWLLMGFGLAGIGMSIMHDANHGAYSSNKMVNYLMGHTLNFVGGSVFNWKLQHNILHHTYTNVAYMDDDIDDKLVLRFNPHTKVKGYQKLQYIFMCSVLWNTHDLLGIAQGFHSVCQVYKKRCESFFKKRKYCYSN